MAAMSDVGPEDSGLASGITNTAFMIGGALGLAVLASIASARTQQIAAAGHDALSALTSGYHVAFAIGAVFAIVAAVLGLALLRTRHAAAGARGAELAVEPV
jgi:MFS family permease